MNNATSWSPDTLNQNMAEFEKIVGNLENMRAQIQNDIEKLRPLWTTDGGKQTLGDLDQFFKNDYSKVQEAMNLMRSKYGQIAQIFQELNNVR